MENEQHIPNHPSPSLGCSSMRSEVSYSKLQKMKVRAMSYSCYVPKGNSPHLTMASNAGKEVSWEIFERATVNSNLVMAFSLQFWLWIFCKGKKKKHYLFWLEADVSSLTMLKYCLFPLGTHTVYLTSLADKNRFLFHELISSHYVSYIIVLFLKPNKHMCMKS